MPKIVALVPIRHQSQRVEGKNYRLLAGKPLFHHIITTLLACPEISYVAVDTDSPPVIDGLQESFPEVRVIKRPEHLREDRISMNEILEYDTSQEQADFFLQTHATNPLLRPRTISQALQTMLANFPSYDSLFSVTRIRTRLWDQQGKAINHDPGVLLQTQDLPPIYEENSCIYIFTRQLLARRHNRLGEHPLMFEMEALESWDIDEELDFAIADFLMRLRLGQEK